MSLDRLRSLVLFSSLSPPAIYLFSASVRLVSPGSLPSPLSFPSRSPSKWVSSGVLAGRNHPRVNTLLSVVKASPRIPFYTHKCHFPFVHSLAALAEPSRPRALCLQQKKANSVGKHSSCIPAPLTPAKPTCCLSLGNEEKQSRKINTKLKMSKIACEMTGRRGCFGTLWSLLVYNLWAHSKCEAKEAVGFEPQAFIGDDPAKCLLRTHVFFGFLWNAAPTSRFCETPVYQINKGRQ